MAKPHEPPPSCTAGVGAGSEHLCMLPSYLYPVLTVPLFAHQFFVDDIFIERLFGIPIRSDEPFAGLIKEYAMRTRSFVVDDWIIGRPGTNATASHPKLRHGAYLVSCRSHVNFKSRLRVGGVSPQDALERWVSSAERQHRQQSASEEEPVTQHVHVDPPCGFDAAYFPNCNSCSGI